MRRAIVAVSFGTTHADAAAMNIQPVEDALRAAFEGWEVHRAWTSRMIVKRVRQRGDQAETEAEAIARLQAEGVSPIVLASTHIIGGQEYERLRQAADGLPVSTPLLNTGDDLCWMATLLGDIAREEGRTLLVMGHGTDHAADDTYARLRKCLPEDVKLACVEGRHSLDGILDALERVPGKQLTLMPLMLVAGDHAKNDLAGDAPDSWKSRLEVMGFDIRVRLQGLGSLPQVQRRFVEKVRSAMDGVA